MAVVYVLECQVNGFGYIGVTSAKLSKRMREHRCLCRNNKHHAIKLTKDWHEFGEEAFVIRILETTDYSHRGSHCQAEQKWIDHYEKLGKLYNGHNRSSGLGAEITRKGVEASRTAVGNRWSAEANEKRSMALRGRPKTAEHTAKVKAAKLARKQANIS